VTVIRPRDALHTNEVMQERAFADPKIRFLWETVAGGVGADTVGGLAVRSVEDRRDLNALRQRPVRRDLSRPAYRARLWAG
jgi:thioredoxin reductase